jgi:hypothetical protein
MGKFTPEYLTICRDAMSAQQAKSLSETNNWSHVDKSKVHEDWDNLYRNLAPLIDRFEASSEPVQTIMAQHYSIACRFYTPSRDAYIGMSLFYGENEAMAKFHNGYHPMMVSFLQSAMAAFASRL